MSEPGGPEAVASPDDPQAADGYRFRAGEFEGPLDLLLHLVRINEVEVTDIPIHSIADQYNEYLDMLREMNLEVAGEYLVMAATLMHIKSRMLLPPDPQAGEDEEQDDPRAALTQQLLEYEKFKQATENIQAMDSRRHLIWTREIMIAEFEGEELLAVDLFDLLKAFRGLLSRLGEEANRKLRRDNVSVADKINWLTELLKERRSVDLLQLLTDLSGRLDRIATFLAVLEMMRLQWVVVFQRTLFGEIRIARRETVGDESAQGEPS